MTIEVSNKSKNTKCKNKILGCLSMLPLLAFAPHAKADLITNGSFETVTPALPVNGICRTASSPYPYGVCSATGWTGNYQIGNGATIGIYGVSFGIPQPDPGGTNALIIQSAGTAVLPSATQSITVPTDGSYTLTFYAANRSNVNTGPQTISVLLNDTPITGGTYSNLSRNWTLETLSFSAPAGIDSLTFEGLDSASTPDVSAFIDDVSLNASSLTSTTPEPSSFALAGISFMGIAAALRATRKRLLR